MPRKPNPETVLKKELKAAIDAGDWDKAQKITAILKGEPVNETVENSDHKYLVNPPHPIPGKTHLQRPPGFVDDPNYCKDDKEVSRILASSKKVSRGIRQGGLVEINCDKCGKRVEVSRKLIIGCGGSEGREFHCDRCLGTAPRG